MSWQTRLQSLAAEIRDEREARLAQDVTDAFTAPAPRDPFRNLTYRELATVCGCGRKSMAPCPICRDVEQREEQQRRTGP